MIHKYPHADMFDPTCGRCQEMHLSSLGPGWCEEVTGMSPSDLREWAFAHGSALGEQVMSLPAINSYFSRAKQVR